MSSKFASSSTSIKLNTATALLDTGYPITIIKDDIFNKLAPANYSKTFHNSYSLLRVNNTSLEILTEMKLTIGINENFNSITTTVIKEINIFRSYFKN